MSRFIKLRRLLQKKLNSQGNSKTERVLQASHHLKEEPHTSPALRRERREEPPSSRKTERLIQRVKQQLWAFPDILHQKLLKSTLKKVFASQWKGLLFRRRTTSLNEEKFMTTLSNRLPWLNNPSEIRSSKSRKSSLRASSKETKMNSFSKLTSSHSNQLVKLTLDSQTYPPRSTQASLAILTPNKRSRTRKSKPFRKLQSSWNQKNRKPNSE